MFVTAVVFGLDSADCGRQVSAPRTRRMALFDAVGGGAVESCASSGDGFLSLDDDLVQRVLLLLTSCDACDAAGGGLSDAAGARARAQRQACALMAVCAEVRFLKHFVFCSNDEWLIRNGTILSASGGLWF